MVNNIFIREVFKMILLTFLDSFPYMVLALYTFRGHWRFGKRVTLSLLAAAAVIQMILVPLNTFSGTRETPFFDVFLSAIQIVFFFVAVKDHIGKLIFSVLVITNLGTFVVASSLWLKITLFPEQTLLYDQIYILLNILMLAVIIPVMYLFIFKDISSPRDREEDSSPGGSVSGFMWRYLWIIPAVFYLIWAYHLYSGNGYHVDLSNIMFLFLIDAGSILIYRTIIQTVNLYEKNTALLAENHVLSIQRLQYDSLNERLENMRRTRHDLRHYVALLKQIRDSQDLSALDELINTYTEQNLLDQPLICCENEIVNVILALYSETAYNSNISFSVKADIPKTTFVDKKDLTVLFGNILENATDACKEVQGERFISLSAAYNPAETGPHSLSLIVKNNYATEPSLTERGIFRSTKHPGDGIGISSVKSITDKYGGACTFSHEDGIFTVSVILYDIIP